MRHLHAAALLALGFAASAFGGSDQRPTDGPGGSLAVFDAQGKYVGPLVSFVDQSIATVIAVNGALVVVPISRAPAGAHLSASAFEWSSSASFVNYPTADCSGPPIVSATSITGAGDAAPVRPSLTIRNGAQTVVYIAPDTYSSTIAEASQNEGSFGCAAFPSSSPTTGWLPATTYSLDQNYPEPLTVRIDDQPNR